MTVLTRLALPLIALVCALPAHAGPHHALAPQHGGIVREVRDLSYELVARPDRLVVHVSDHGKPVSTAGARAQITLTGASAPVQLAPVAGNQLIASGSFRVGLGVRAILEVSLPGHRPARVIFPLK